MRLLLVVMGVLFLAACNTSPGPGPDKGTKVETIVAVVDGKPAKGFHAAPPIDDNTIDCDYATISRAATTMGVFGGCGASAQNPDVCWPGEGVKLLCGTGPWSRELLEWRITSGKLPLQAEPLAQPEPWGMELADGRRCRARVGGAWGGRSDGMVGAYSCTGQGGEVVLQAENATSAVDRSKAYWTVDMGQLGPDNPHFGPPTKVQVKVAYFAGSQAGG